MLRNMLLIILALLLVNSTFAQNQVIAKLKQPPPNKLGISDLWSLELNNISKKDIRGYVTGSLSEDKDGIIVEGQSKTILIKAGRGTYTYKDFSDADIRYSNNKYKEILLRTGGAPEGDYTICVTVYSEEGDVIGLENCVYHSVRQLGNISLLSPADGEESFTDQPIVFSWTPLPDSKEYSLKIVELIGNQSPENAIQQNPPFFAKENIRATQFQYQLNERKFQAEKSYAWIINSNGVLSDIGFFKVKSRKNNDDNKSFTQYRLIVMYPDEEFSKEEIVSWADEFEPIIQSFKVNSDMPNRISTNFTTSKQSQKIKSIEEAKNIFEQFVAQVESQEELPFGDDVIILSGKQGNCPPADCGCDKPGAIYYCKCVMYQGICMCNICPDKCVITEMEVEDPVLELGRVINPGSGNDSTKIKDVVLVLTSSRGDQCEGFKKGLRNGLKIVDELRKANEIENFVITQTYKPKSISEIKYRFILMYPESESDVTKIDRLQNDLEDAFSLIKIDSGMPNRISMNFTTKRQNQKNNNPDELKQLSEDLFNLIESQTEFPFGDDVTILVGKQGNCPPADCGCSTPGSIIYCKCVVYQGTCMCNICPDKVVLTDIETEDPVLQFRTIQTPPVKTDSTLIRDVIIVFRDSGKEELKGLKKGIKVGLEIVDDLRKNNKDKDKPVKVKYDLKENIK